MSVPDTRPLTELFKLLSHPRRRFVLHHIQGTQREATLQSLAKHILTCEVDGTDIPSTAFAVESVRVSLHHTHLPKLADAGLLDYDAHTGRIKAGDRRVPEGLLDEELRTERRSVLAAGP